MSERNLSKLEKLSGVTNLKQLTITLDAKEKMGEEFSKLAQKNSKKIFVYKFTYRSRGKNIIGFLVEPRTDSKLPCIIWNRGGSADFGAVKLGQLFAGSPAELAKAGYVVIASQYSGGPGSEGEEEWGGGDVTDVLNLKKILKEYSRADEGRIGMYGGSRGGMMTYLSLAKVRWLKAAVTVAGSADLFRGKKERPELYKRVFKPYFGGTKEGMRARSAVYWADKFASKTPLLMMHGTADWRVSPLESLELAGELYKHKKPYRLIMFEGANHGLTEVKEEENRQMIEWFDRFVKNEEQLPSLRPHGA